MPDVTVSILTCSRVDLAKACIASILAGGEDVAFILTANGCPEAERFFREVEESISNVTVVVNRFNEGFWKPSNYALALTKTKWLCLANDDILVPHGWLEQLKKPFLQYDDSVFSCPDSGCSELDRNFRGKRGAREYCEASCLLMDVEKVITHGLFEEMPGAAYCEDSHASLRFRELGYRLNWVPLKISHAYGASSRSIPEARMWHDLNRDYCMKRWADYLKSKDRKFPCEK